MRLLIALAAVFAVASAFAGFKYPVVIPGIELTLPVPLSGLLPLDKILELPLDVSKFNDALAAKCFNGFKDGFGKKYANDAEQSKAFRTFNENAKKIIALGAKAAKKGSAKFGLNKYCDLTDEEFAEKVLMKNEGEPTSFVDYERQNHTVHPKLAERPRRTQFQDDWYVDWRDTPYAVGPVRDQSSCGCCWAFTAASVIQSVYGIKNKKTIQPSEQQICDCGMMDPTTPGCNGGSSATALQYAVKTGVSLEAFYTAYSPSRATKANVCDDKSKPNTIKIKSATQIYPADDTEMSDALDTYGPIAAAFKVGSSFRYYKSGVYYNEDCDDPATYLGGHAISIVGYGEEEGTPYWIVKNSWGTSYGESGYVKFAKGWDLCTIESRRVVYAVAL